MSGKTSRIVAALLLVLSFAAAQKSGVKVSGKWETQPALIYRPVSVSLIPPVSTNWLSAGRVRSNFSLNILGGRLGALEGVELGGLFNSVRYGVTGFQSAFGANACGGSLRGVQAAFGASVAGGSVHGAQVAFGATIAGGDLTGLQAAFGACVAGGDVTGAQVASGVNVCGGSLRGVQLGPANICEGEAIAQLGFVNAAGRNRFAQLGFVNIADRSDGVQLGFVNIAGQSDWSFGFVSIADEGRFDVCVEASDAPLAAIALKAGTRRVYNVFTVGYTPADSARLFAGIGIGVHFPFDRLFVDVDVTTQSVFFGPDWFAETSGFGLLTRIRPTVGYRLTRWLAVTAGPNLAWWTSDDVDGSSVTLYDLPLAESVAPYRRLWPGFTVGLQLTPGAAE
ncbi:MAG: hypothetical protein R6X13_01300 [bacterium]